MDAEKYNTEHMRMTADSFNAIALFEDRWDHNRVYSDIILKSSGTGHEEALDIGCGTGEFAKKLASVAKRVTGIDISPIMISEAGKRHPAENIFIQGHGSFQYA